jgi:signal transduction histidine kinase
MPTRPAALLPLHQLLAELDEWRLDQSSARTDAVGEGLAQLAFSYDVRGAYLELTAPPLPGLSVGAGSLATGPAGRTTTGNAPTRHELHFAGLADGKATLWADDREGRGGNALASALELAIESTWSKQEAHFRREQLEALDAAVRGIAGVASVDRVLQLIVDRVRDLAGAQYAALGIVGPFGSIEQFITSGISGRQHAQIGAPPRGHGLLGLIIREDASFLIDDIATDPRRYGFPPEHPEMHSFLGVPVRSKGRSIGNLYVTNKVTGATFSESDLRLVEMFALHAGIAIENARLHDEIQRLAVVGERERISQDLHDSIIQSLYAISLSLEDLPDIIAEDAGEGAARADRAIDSIHGTIRDIRNFIMGLQPELLEEADLAAGVESLAAEFRANTLIDLEVRVDPTLPEIPRDHAAHVLAMTREALSNIARHSGATRASVELGARDGTLRLVIGDNGHGFDPDQPRSNRQHGLANLRSRAEAAGGSLAVSSEIGAGTRLEADIPIPAVGD